MMKLFKHIGYFLMVMAGMLLISCASANREKALEAMRIRDSLWMEKADADSIYEFEHDTLSTSSLNAFEVRAVQKLGDVSDFIQMLSDTLVDKSFKLQAKQMMLGNFSSAKNTIDIRFDARDKPVKIELGNFIDSLIKRRYLKLRIELSNIHVVRKLEYSKEGTYKGLLSFQEMIVKTDKNITLRLFERSVKADFSLQRVSKKFGNTTKEIWEVLLGDIEIMEGN